MMVFNALLWLLCPRSDRLGSCLGAGVVLTSRGGVFSDNSDKVVGLPRHGDVASIGYKVSANNQIVNPLGLYAAYTPVWDFPSAFLDSYPVTILEWNAQNMFILPSVIMPGSLIIHCLIASRVFRQDHFPDLENFALTGQYYWRCVVVHAFSVSVQRQCQWNRCI